MNPFIISSLLVLEEEIESWNWHHIEYCLWISIFLILSFEIYMYGLFQFQQNKKSAEFQPRICILLSGFPMSGKDTAAEWIKDHFHPLCKRYYSFASSLKQECSEHSHIPLHYFTNHEYKNAHHRQYESITGQQTIREYLIEFAKQKRLNDEHCFTKALVQQVCNDQCQCVIISDFRYPHERQYLQSVWPTCRFFSIFIERPSITDHYHDFIQITKQKCDYVLLNNGSLEHFKINLLRYLRNYIS